MSNPTLNQDQSLSDAKEESMKKKRSTLVFIVTLLALTLLTSTALADNSHNFTASLKGGEEVPANDSKAQGQAIFKVSKDGESISYKLIVANIENVSMAHIHLAPAGVNGPVVAWLYPDSPPAQLIPGRFDGILAEGTLTAANLVGLLAGQSLDALVDEMASGNAYVNVHTSQFPGGEVRGQIR
jgi:hypothetical protein